ncbi:hypothetical protein CTheo_8623 [Ceratobasidium theobromae]|uniref:Transmembrane protein n=1 Tax=Ceratobasidium theobromae TaxID=1582974 RepID=A0A5N5Q888_9AGAM|nr:hypothetical protein CTheo_8623 [Ceratobasidium theobromae]
MSLADSACRNSTQTAWMLSGNRTPCEILQSLVRVCAPSAAVQHLSVDVSCAALGTNSTTPCCCSTVAYALPAGSAKHRNLRAHSQLRTFPGSPAARHILMARGLSSVITSASQQIAIPSWAFVRPSAMDATWNMSRAQLTANVIASTTTSPIPSSSSATSEPHSSNPHPRYYIPATISSVLAFFLLLGMGVWLYRRRNRISSLSRPPPDFEIDGATSGLLPKGSSGRPKSWAWWSNKLGRSRSRRNNNDPSKIDAWRYPFEYTPVSIGSSNSGSGRVGQPAAYYSPYNPPDDQHLRPRPSVDTIRAQGSNGTPRQHHSSTPTPRYSATSLAPGQGFTGPIPPQAVGFASPVMRSASPAPSRYTPTPGPGLVSGNATPNLTNQRSAQFISQQPIPPGYTSAATSYPPLQPPHHYPYTGASAPTTPPQHVFSLSPQIRPQTHLVELQLLPEEYERLRSLYPEMHVRTRRRRQRDGDGAESGSETEAVRERPGLGAGAGAGTRARAGRPRSWSMPVVPVDGPLAPVGSRQEDERDRRPRNGVELREKYARGRRRRGTDCEALESGGQRDSAAANSGAGATASGRSTTPSGVVASGGGGRTRDWEPRRAIDGGISLMGGPPRRH